MKWIIFIAILVVAVIVFRIVKKNRKAKKERIAKEERRAALNKRAIDTFFTSLSITKELLPVEELAKIAPFELRYTERTFYGYRRAEGLLTKRTAVEIIWAFLSDKKQLKKLAKSDVAHKEIDAFSDVFMRKMIDEAKKESKEPSLTFFWIEFIYPLYRIDLYPIYDEKDFDLYTELIIHDIKEVADFNILLARKEQTTKLNTWRVKILESEHYKNLVQKELKLQQEKLQAELEAFKIRGVIDEEFISYVKNNHNKKELLVIREAFDEIAFEELMNKFFPGQDYTQVKPEFLTILAQAYSNFTLKLFG